MHAGYTVPGVVTGKPISIGGSEGRNEATARGCVYMHRRGRQPPRHRTSRAPRSRSRASATPARSRRALIGDEGATVVAVSDSTGGIHNPDGLDIARVIAWKKEHGTVRGFPGATEITQRRAARARLRHPDPGRAREPDHGRNAGQHQGQDRRRGRQRPDHARGRRRSCTTAGVFVIPDILCNAGGVTVSYFEWVQDLNRDHWRETSRQREARGHHGQGLQRDARRSRTRARSTCGPAAYLMAVQRVADATAMRGLYP